MKKYFDQFEKSKAIYSSMPVEMQQKLDAYIQGLEKKANTFPQIKKMLDQVDENYSDIPSHDIE